jgi:hypothetical protein
LNPESRRFALAVFAFDFGVATACGAEALIGVTDGSPSSENCAIGFYIHRIEVRLPTARSPARLQAARPIEAPSITYFKKYWQIRSAAPLSSAGP